MRVKSTKVIHRKLGREQADGLAYDELNEVHIDERLRKKEYLLVVIHELLHVYFPDWTERQVVKYSKMMCNDLWKLKFRKVDE
jgi:hypothetical protein